MFAQEMILYVRIFLLKKFFLGGKFRLVFGNRNLTWVVNLRGNGNTELLNYFCNYIVFSFSEIVYKAIENIFFKKGFKVIKHDEIVVMQC